jgi:hypothetical protein
VSEAIVFRSATLALSPNHLPQTAARRSEIVLGLGEFCLKLLLRGLGCRECLAEASVL